jgi:hypothetical protein
MVTKFLLARNKLALFGGRTFTEFHLKPPNPQQCQLRGLNDSVLFFFVPGRAHLLGDESSLQTRQRDGLKCVTIRGTVSIIFFVSCSIIKSCQEIYFSLGS